MEPKAGAEAQGKKSGPKQVTKGGNTPMNVLRKRQGGDFLNNFHAITVSMADEDLINTSRCSLNVLLDFSV